MLARASYIEHSQSIGFRGYWEGSDYDEFWQAFTEVVDSYSHGQIAKSKEVLTELVDSVSNPGSKTKEEVFSQIWKWVGIILTASIVLGFVKWFLGRWY